MSAATSFTIALCIGGFLLSALLTKVVISIASDRGIVDIPNQRSSHTMPIPRGGGIPFVIIFLFALAVESLLGSSWGEPGIAVAILAGAALVAGVGFLDDLINVSPQGRLLTHFAAAAVMLLVLPQLPSLPVFGETIKPETLLFPVMLLGIVWSVNLFNFMDGIDGIAGVQAITVVLCGLAILEMQGNSEWRELLLLLASVVGGFLVWNWPPASVFMGDAASGFLGFCLAAIAIATSMDASINLWVWLILGGVFLVDSTTTLIVRIIRGEVWYRPHRSHAYQILSRKFESHAKVTLAVLVINVVWLFPLALLAAWKPALGATLWLLAWLPLVFVVIGVGAGRPEVAEAAISSSD